MMSSRRSLGLLLAAALGLAGCQKPTPVLTTSIPWALAGQWLVVDLHTHTKYTDGSLTVAELVRLAQASGCTGLAITDHGDRDRRGASPDYFTDIERARDTHPDMVLLAGLEWNVPPYGGREHAGVLLDRGLERQVLPEFKAQFDGGKGGNAGPALEWLAKRVGDRPAVLFYNHPSRKDDDPQENARDMALWRKANKLMVGFEGAPGHQIGAKPGSYGANAWGLQGRWDHIAATVGGAWDQLLDQGDTPWAALANSDYHEPTNDAAPCAFARTHVMVPRKTPDGLLQALRAGAFWADHGQLLDALTFQLDTAGLVTPAMPGETVAASTDSPLEISVSLRRGPGAAATPLVVELIGNGSTGQPTMIGQATLPPGKDSHEFRLAEWRKGKDGESAYFRVRVRKPDGSGRELQAYTNPIRVRRP